MCERELIAHVGKVFSVNLYIGKGELVKGGR